MRHAHALLLPTAALCRADFLIDFFEKPFLAGVKPLAQPLLDIVEDTPSLAYAVLGAPLALLALLFLALRPRSRKVGLHRSESANEA